MTSPGTPKPTTPLVTFLTGETTQRGVSRFMARRLLYGIVGFVVLCAAVALLFAFPPLIVAYAVIGVWGVVTVLRKP